MEYTKNLLELKTEFRSLQNIKSIHEINSIFYGENKQSEIET